MDGRQGEVTTNDGVRLRYRETGSGQPLVLVHGWSQAAALFQYQLDGLSDRSRVIAYDQRGHGESDKPAFGYRIARLAKDLHEFLVALNLRDAAVLGHSMGCSVLWAYWDLFGAERLAKLILVDQPSFLMDNPAWSPAEREAAGARRSPDEQLAWCNDVAASTGEAPIHESIARMTTVSLDPTVKAWMVEHNLKMPRAAAATLGVGGQSSIFPWRSQAWIHEQIPGSHLEVFDEAEGSHFMFIENPTKFNRLVAEFIG